MIGWLWLAYGIGVVLTPIACVVAEFPSDLGDPMEYVAAVFLGLFWPVYVAGALIVLPAWLIGHWTGQHTRNVPSPPKGNLVSRDSSGRNFCREPERVSTPSTLEAVPREQEGE